MSQSELEQLKREACAADTIARLVDTEQVAEFKIAAHDVLPKRYAYRFVKRAFDIVSCSCALVVCAIPMLVVAVLIKRDSPGSVLYRQERLGLNGKPFMMVKFRSMYVDAEARGAQWAQVDDPRVTSIGKIIRASRLDELPQLWNILKGDMSVVGPRPERPCFYELFETYIHGFSKRTLVKPGLTGYAQVNGGYDLKPEEKIVYDLEYINKQSISLDLWCIFKTVKLLFTHEGAR